MDIVASEGLRISRFVPGFGRDLFASIFGVFIRILGPSIPFFMPRSAVPFDANENSPPSAPHDGFHRLALTLAAPIFRRPDRLEKQKIYHRGTEAHRGTATAGLGKGGNSCSFRLAGSYRRRRLASSKLKDLGGPGLAGDVERGPLAASAFGQSLFCREAGDFRMIICLAEVGKHEHLGRAVKIFC